MKRNPLNREVPYTGGYPLSDPTLEPVDRDARDEPCDVCGRFPSTGCEGHPFDFPPIDRPAIHRRPRLATHTHLRVVANPERPVLSLLQGGAFNPLQESHHE